MSHLINELFSDIRHLAKYVTWLNISLGQILHFANESFGEMRQLAKKSLFISEELTRWRIKPSDAFSNSEKGWLFWQNDAFSKWDFGEVTYSDFEIAKKLLLQNLVVTKPLFHYKMKLSFYFLLIKVVINSKHWL